MHYPSYDLRLDLSYDLQVTTVTQSFVSLILNYGTSFAAVPATKKHFFDHFNWRLTSQLINDILNAIQKFSVCPVICCVNLKEIPLLLVVGKSITLLLLSITGSYQ